MKKAFSILVLCGIIMLMISCSKKSEIPPIDSVTNKALCESYKQQEGYALVDGKKVHYWLYDTYTNHDGYGSYLIDQAFPQWVEKLGYVIDFENIRDITPDTDIAFSVKALMRQRDCDVAITIWQNESGDTLVVNNYDAKKEVYWTIIYPLVKYKKNDIVKKDVAKTENKEEENDLDDLLETESPEEDDEAQPESEEKADQKTYSYTYPGDSSPTEVTVAFLGRGVTKTKWEKAKPKMMKEIFNHLDSVPFASMIADFKEIELLIDQERWFIRKALSEYNLSDSEIYYIYFSINKAVSFIMVRIENNCKSYRWLGFRGYINPFKILNRLK